MDTTHGPAEEVQMRHLFKVVSGSTPSGSEVEYWGGEVNWVTPADIGSLSGIYLRTTDRTLTNEGVQACGAQLVPAGSIVVTKRAPIGNVAILAASACSNQGCLLLAAERELDTRFYFYWLKHSAEGLNALGRGSTFLELSTEDLKSLRVPLPQLASQRAIADFLDAETARIDALIAAKENLLAMLAEKRRALVTQAVTRGLDPSVPMRDSGIPWLGEIPAHWDEVRLRFLFDRIEQGWSPQAESREPSENEWGVLKLSAVSRGYFDESAAKALPPELEPRLDYEVQAGDFLLTRANTPSLVGDVCFVEATRPKLMLCDLIYRLALRPKLVDGRYLAHFLGLPLGRSQIEADARGTSSSMVKISQEHIKSWLVLLPPLQEQVEITAHLNRDLEAISRIESASTATLGLLRERREAVIAAAVTGQLEPEAS